MRLTNASAESSSSDEPEETQCEARAQDELPMLYCPVCDARLLSRQCKLMCERCGYFMSCADYY